jgi:RND family efflux transporter MFP subunit
MIRYQVPAALAATLLLGAGIAGCNRADDASASATETAEAVVTVGPENIAIATLAELRSGPTISGSLAPEQSATVRAEVGGSVLRTSVDAGQRVKRGQLLANLDDRAVEESFLSARSTVRSAESSLELARRNLQRTERLTQAGALPERDLETARLDVTNAEGALADARARLTNAQEQLEDTRVRAPFDGTVSERQVDAGDVVQVGAALFSIVDPRRLRLEATVPAEEIGRLRPGTEVEFTVTGVDRRITGRIERINPVVDSTTRQIRIYVAIPNLDQALVAGLFAEGRVATDTKRAVAVPVTAIDSRGNTPQVHLIKRGRVAEAEIRPGVRDEAAELVEILAGVAAGDTVLLGSAQGVTPGSRVRVLQEEAGR